MITVAVTAFEAMAFVMARFGLATPAGIALTLLVLGLTGLADVLQRMPSMSDITSGFSRMFDGIKGIFNRSDEAARSSDQRSNNAAKGLLGPDGYLLPGSLLPGFQRQSYAPPHAANSNRATPIVLHIDGREVARGVMPHIGREMDTVPTGRTGFDARMSPRFGGAAFSA